MLTNPQTQSVTLFFAEQEHIPNNFAIETSANTRIEFAIGNHSQPAATTDATNAEPIVNASVEPPATTTPETLAKLRKLLALAHKKPKPHASDPVDSSHTVDTINDTVPENKNSDDEENEENKPIDVEQHQGIAEPIVETSISKETVIASLAEKTSETNETTEKTVVVVDEKKSQHKPLALPKAIDEVNINACNNHFQTLNYQQQKDVLAVFYHMLKVSKIRSTANYFISLVTSAKEGSLTIPSEAKSANKSQTPEAIAKRKAQDEEREQRALHWSNYCWVKQQAELKNKSEQEVAIAMGFEDAYALFAESQSCAT